jgi:hypothetical protein
MKLRKLNVCFKLWITHSGASEMKSTQKRDNAKGRMDRPRDWFDWTGQKQ